MKCTECGSRTRVLESRPRPKAGGVWRRRECENGHRFNTSEVSDLAMLENALVLEAERRGRKELAKEIAAVIAAAKEKNPEELAHAS